MPITAHSSSKTNKLRQKLSLEQRSRSIPYKKPYVVAVLATLLFYLGLVALFTSVIALVAAPPELEKSAAYTMVTMLPICSLLWIVAYFKRRKAICPLCQCTPLLDNLARKHVKAFKCKPWNYGTTAILNVVFSQRFRCMHCGTPFDLLKSKRKPISTSPEKQ